MGVLDTRRGRIAAVLLGVIAFTAVMLTRVLATIFFAVSLAYVLYPFERRLADRGIPDRIAAALITTSAFLATVLLLVPVFLVAFRRRQVFVDFLSDLPEQLELVVLGMTYVVEVDAVVPVVSRVLQDVAVAIARATPVLAAKLFLFAFLLYATLLRPEGVRDAVFGVVPASHHDDVVAFHERVRGTLHGIYVVQAATAVLTFLIALVVFYLLGYRAFFTFAVLAGVLQFVPVLGPSLLVAGIAATDYLTGAPTRAVVVLVVGFVVIGALPDVILRPRLAHRTTGLPASLYFVGFTAGALSFGAVGIIAGPVVIALLLEAVELASAESVPVDSLPDYFQ